MRAMDPALYRSHELADRIEALIASRPDDADSDSRSFSFERVGDSPERRDGQPMN